MLPSGTIETSHIWKRFRADRRRHLFRDELQRLRARLTRHGGRGWRWALRDVNLQIEPGESVGLVGVNGSGKTTLLKILTRVMYPYAGRVNVSGRVGALIEVRSGIHPDLTGRENVYLMGSLLGLKRREVSGRFDVIVAFAELNEAIDRQVKFYSSGMQTRLGFAVAAFLEPDVLLVDEVLAVGDASFQQKCLDRMRTVIAEGTTIVFVSHDLAAVESTCTRGVWLDGGAIRSDGPVREVLGRYRQSIEQAAELTTKPDGVIRVLKAEASTNGHGAQPAPALEVCATLESQEPRSAILFLGVSEGPATPIFVVRRDLSLQVGRTEARCTIRHLPLPRGRFYVWMAALDERGRDLLPWHPAAHFDLMGPRLDRPPKGIVRLAPVHVDAQWEVSGR
jgi:ABC-type polysaccharide/polyol phosphate transport system ATPase subunit